MLRFNAAAQLLFLSKQPFSDTRTKVALTYEICPQILFWNCSIYQKKKITATQRAFLPLTELLIQCSEYHQSMSAESYHVLEQESILEPGQL